MPASETETMLDRESVVAEGARLPLRVWLRLLTCTQMIESMVRARLRAEFGTTLARFDLLAALDASGGALTMGALSARLMVTSGNVTGLIDGMEQDGLVIRQRHPKDRRSTVIVTTPQGRSLFARMAPAHAGWIEQAMAGLDRQEAAALWRSLGRLKSSAALDGRDQGR